LSFEQRRSAPAPVIADAASKVPEATLGFWIVKCLVTTLGETGGDALSMQFGLGYGVSTLIFAAFFAVVLTAQVAAWRYHTALYWAVVVATTTVGTTTSDFFDRTLGLGYVLSSAVLLAVAVAVLAIWRRTRGLIAVDHIAEQPDEVFYWLTILVSNTLGTALGDFTATDLGLGFEGGAVVFLALICLVAVARFSTRAPPAILFWSAYALTRPFGATLGDALTKPRADGGLALGRLESSLVIAATMALVLVAAHRLQRPRDRSPAGDEELAARRRL
jgi:uncharacterized membrane-anchored protein